MPLISDKKILRRSLPPRRRLKAPNMHYVPAVSLPRLLAEYVTNKDTKVPLSGFVIPSPAVDTADDAEEQAQRESAPCPRSLSEDVRSASAGRNKAYGNGGGALSALKRALHQADTHNASSMSLLDATPRAGDLQPLILSSEISEISGNLLSSGPTLLDYVQQQQKPSEYERKRQVHPRLRWPRLASRGSDSGSGLGSTTPPPQTASSTTSFSLDLKRGSRNNLDDDKKSEGTCHTSNFGTSKQSQTAKSPRPKGPSPRPAVLPRSNIHQESPSGVVSTMHIPAPHRAPDCKSWFGSTTSLANTASRTSFGTAVSNVSSSVSTKRVDRKWFLRMAPISCLPKEAISKEARRAATAGAAQGTDNGFDVGGEAGEYLAFERWSLSDDYLESLLTAHCNTNGSDLRGLRFLNLSQNRLTEAGILKLLGFGLPENLVSLILQSNGFGERGGFAAISLVRRCHRLKELDLSRNNIGDDVAEELCGLLDHQCPELEGLGLSGCGLGATPKSGIALGNFLGVHDPLKALDLSWNALHGAGALAMLKGLYSNGLEGGGNLRRLNLAWNRMGSGQHADQRKREDGERAAKMLSSIFQDGVTLFHLDLSYNGFIAEHCAVLATGLKHNHTLFGIHLVGNEATLDDLGFVIPLFGFGKKSWIAAQAQQSETTKAGPVTLLDLEDADFGNVVEGAFADHEGHLRNMNSMARSVPTGLKLQHPRVMRAGDLGKLHFNPSLHSLEPDTFQSFSEEDLHVEHAWIEDSSRVQTTADWLKQDLESLSRNTTCCWICENWVEYKVTYIPGYSGSETDASAVENVSAFFSIDGYTRPTILRLVEETQRKSICGLRMQNGRSFKRGTSRLSLAPGLLGVIPPMLPNPGGKKPKRKQSRMLTSEEKGFLLNSHGKVTKWVGVRMLPPTTELLHLVFLVNNVLTVAQDLEKETLASPKTIAVKASKEGAMQCLTFQDVNTVSVGTTAWEMFRRGRHHAVCVLEDPLNRSEFTVMPRKLIEAAEKPKKQAEIWTVGESVFKDYLQDSQERSEQCFDRDWSHSRLPQMLRNEETRREICNFVRSRYLHVMTCFWVWAFSGFDDRSHACGVSFVNFREQLIALGGQGPGRLVDGNYCKLSDPDCVFVAAHVIEQHKRPQFKVLPEKALARFQFLEGVVRLAFRRYLTRTANSSSARDCVSAVETFFRLTSLGEDFVRLRASMHESLLTEECCLTYKEHMDTLKGVYEGYKTVFSYPNRSGKQMSYGAWLELMADANVISEDFSLKKCGMAFALGKEIRVDVTSDWRHMELSWSEFLVALAAVVRLRPDWDREFFADLLDEFFTEFIAEAYSKMIDMQPGRDKAFKNLDAQMQPLVNFLIRIFEDADDDKSGSCDLREFKRALNNPPVREEFNRLGLTVSDLDVLFRTLDVDYDGEITMDEIIDGFIKMKTAMRGLEKAISYVRKAFYEADKDANGTLDIEEFHNLFEQPAVQRKLAALGVSGDDVSDLFNIMDTESDGAITVEEIIQGLITLRDPSTRGLRGVRLLRQLFEEADADGSGSLDLKEVEDTLAQPDVEEKFQRMNLQVPNWLTLFEELDTDGSGDLSWEEIEEGMKAYWSRSSQ